MSALLNNLPRYRRMTADDLDAIMIIENDIYPHPWTRGNFSDSLNAGYHCVIVDVAGIIVGYSVVMIAAEEAHLLNLSVAAAWQRRGFGRAMLAFVVKLAKDFGAGKTYLEVRPSNTAGRRLYASAGFSEIAMRRGYYPVREGREDAVVMELQLK